MTKANANRILKMIKATGMFPSVQSVTREPTQDNLQWGIGVGDGEVYMTFREILAWWTEAFADKPQRGRGRRDR